ncbi:hypothetical protein GCM10010320_17440 [Streptomyces caelestis]|nr:hypothetical protein GCM10010320_17440 [Streptomyces caelestis]
MLQGQSEHGEVRHGDGLVAAVEPGRPVELHGLLQVAAHRPSGLLTMRSPFSHFRRHAVIPLRPLQGEYYN